MSVLETCVWPVLKGVVMKIEEEKIIPYDLVVNEPLVESITKYELDHMAQVVDLVQQTTEIAKVLTRVINAMLGKEISDD